MVAKFKNRRRRIPAVASVLAVGIGLTAVVTQSGPVQASSVQESKPVESPTPDGTVTLVTGDRVRVSDRGRKVEFLPATGRTNGGFLSSRADGRLVVVPADVADQVSSGWLDRRLFDITGLLESRYDDAHASTIPLIVSYSGSGVAERRATNSMGAKTVQELPSIRSTALRVPKATASGFLGGLRGRELRASGGIEKIWLDAKFHPTLDQSLPQIGAPAAWQAGYTGKGVKVAVLDSGIDASHPDLADRIAGKKNFTAEEDGDQVGHGTHVASTIAGTAAASAGKYKGVAPAAELLDGKICDASGCDMSTIIAGMQWAATEQHADVVNLSIGGPDGPELDPVEEAVNTLTAQTGALFVVAAGNQGPAAGSIGSPGSADAALTVGAVDKQDNLAEFSSRGPRIGDHAIKPDVTAPGQDIVAAKAQNSVIGDPVGDRYLRLSGTSMATPHVAGAAALLRQQHPGWKAAELKSVLMGTAVPRDGSTVFEQGTGRIDVAKAIRQAVVAEPGTLSFGVASWPHSDDAPVTRQLTYRNASTADVTLSLRATLSGPGGTAAPASALKLSATSLTVPAGGTAAVTVTSDTRHDGPDGGYDGRVIATAADGSATATLVSLTKEVESHELTVTHLGPDGLPATHGVTTLTNLADGTKYDFTGKSTARLPKAQYLVDAAVIGPDYLRLLVDPTMLLDRDVTLTIDARQAKEVMAKVPRPDARPALTMVEGHLQSAATDRNTLGAVFGTDRIYTASLGDSVAAPYEFRSTAAQHLVTPAADGHFTNSPAIYGLVSTRTGTYFDGLTRLVKDRDLAKVVTRLNSQGRGRQGVLDQLGLAPDQGAGFTAGFLFDLPGTATQYLEGGPANWGITFSEVDLEGGTSPVYLHDQQRSLRAGRVYRERWNAAVFGPSFSSFGDAVRYPGSMMFDLPMFSDADDHSGYTTTDAVSLKLYRNGRLLQASEDERFLVEDVPADQADFRLEASYSRSVSPLSTKVEGTWTFKSQAVTAETGEALPLWAVRYHPAVDALNTVKRQPLTILPVTLNTQPGAKTGAINSLKIQASGDSGLTWTTATVTKTATNRYTATFPTPKTATQVSLQATATDTLGNTTHQSILNAYTLR